MRRSMLVMVLLVLSACSPDAESPYKYGYTDAATTRSIVEKAIDMANLVLQKNHSPKLKGSWSAPFKGPADQQEILVYLVRKKGGFADVTPENRAVNNFVASLKALQVNPEAQDCGDLEECVHNLYKNSNIGQTVARIINQHASFNTASTKPEARWIALYDADIQRFQILYDRDLMGYNSLPHFEYFITIMLLHEVGHLNTRFRLDSLTNKTESYERYLQALNDTQREEARADAFAAEMIRRAVFSPANGLTADEKELLLYIPVQALLAYRFFLFDKSPGGLCRHYFDFTKSHPNFEMRYLAMTTLVNPANDLLEKFLDTREALAQKSFTRTNPECTCMHH